MIKTKYGNACITSIAYLMNMHILKYNIKTTCFMYSIWQDLDNQEEEK